MATYHVKTGGGTGSGLDDANAWSYAHLFGATLAAGDTVLFKRGDTFSGQHYAKPGSVGNPVVYDAYGSGANPVISGFTTLSSWTLSTGNIYYATLDVSILHSATLDAVIKGMGRYPNTGYLQYTSHSGNTSITGTSIGALPFNCVGAEVVIRKFRWILDRHFVTAHASNTITYNATSFHGNNNAYDPVDNNGYFIQGHLSCLTEEGDWYYDNPNNRLYMHFGSGTPSGRVVKVSTINQVVPLNESGYITFNNIDFQGGNTAIFNNGVTGIIINDCNFSQQGANAIYGIDCDGMQVTGCNISDSLNNSVFVEVGGTNTTIEDVTILNSGMIAGMGACGDGSYNGIYVAGTDTIIGENSITNCGFNSIHFTGDDVTVENNFINGFCNVKDDGAGIYTVISSDGITASNRVIQNNIILNGVGAYAGAEAYDYEAFGKAAGVYLDDYTNHVEVTENVISNCPWAGIFMTTDGDISITDNILYNSKAQLWINNVAVGRIRNMVITGNTLIARTAIQKTLWLNMWVNDAPSLYGTINNNTYARPVDDDDSIMVDRLYSGGGGFDDQTLAEWKTFSTQDAASVKSLVAITSDTDFLFQYNHTASPVTPSITGNWKDVANASYSTTVTVPAYGGKILLLNTSGFKIYTHNGKILTHAGKILTT